MSAMGSSRLWGKITVLIVVCGWCLSAQAKYDGGSGTEAEPYRISTVSDWEELMATPADWASHFVLTADIDLNDVSITPIAPDTSSDEGFQGTQFTGVFDGNDYVIRNVDVNMPRTNFVGLFGCVGTGGQIKNLGVEDISIHGRTFVGGLAGFHYWTSPITNSHSTGSVTGSAHVGGLVGRNFGSLINCYSTGSVTGDSGAGGLVGGNSGTISNSYSTGSVTGDSFVGGLAGYDDFIISNCYSSASAAGDWRVGGLVGNSYHGTITNSYSTGSVSGGRWSVGGLVGYNDYGSISNSYSTGAVSGDEDVGGLVGENYSGTTSDCYSTGSVSRIGDSVGGLVGRNYGSYGTITNCYSTGCVAGSSLVGGLVGDNERATVSKSFWDVNTSGEPNSAGGIPKTTPEMKQRSTFTSAGWDFLGETGNGTEDIWAICEGTNYPRFVWQIPTGDIVCPDGVNNFDFALLARYWHETDCVALDDCEGADIDLSGAVDFADVAAVAESWMRGVE